MDYTIKFLSPLSHFLSITLKLDVTNNDLLTLTLPIWRPGRYEAANYSKNIRQLSFRDENGRMLPHVINRANQWQIDTKNCQTLTVDYQYFAYQMDAGNSWYDDELIYINFINCLLYAKDRVNDKCTVTIDIPADYAIACSLKRDENVFYASDFYELVDSPLIAGYKIQHLSYHSRDTPFHIWIYGQNNLESSQLIKDFQKFTDEQIACFGDFPEDSYHFLIITLPYKHYHGVEHAKSTVICLGPAQELQSDKMYQELLGVSSHELFHAWNIIKIRPQEMLPYDFSVPVSFPTGFVAEGFTTYYGDLFLCRSKVFDIKWYLNELGILFNRHFWNYGRLNESVIDSSSNLWIDGYTAGAPNKKSSIYVEGALIALTLDLSIRSLTNHEKSLDDVMRILWHTHGQVANGYNLEMIKNYAEEVCGENLNDYFSKYVCGTQDKESLVAELLPVVGCELEKIPNKNDLSRQFGIRTVAESEGLRVMQIAPDAIGEKYFSVKDLIVSIDDQKPETFTLKNQSMVSFKIDRFGRELIHEIKPGRVNYFDEYQVVRNETANDDKQKAFTSWTGQSFN